MSTISQAIALQDNVPTPTEITSQIPHNLTQVPGNGFNLKANSLDYFAWQTFVALNWPSDCQGNPIEDKKIGQNPTAPRVWELYRLPEEVLDIVPNIENCNHPFPIELRFAKAKSKEEYLPLDSISEKLIEQVNLPVVDQKGNYVIDEIRVNPIWGVIPLLSDISGEKTQLNLEKEYIEELEESFNKNFNFVCSQSKITYAKVCSEKNREGTIEVKAAWRVFNNPTDEDRRRYFITKRKLLIPPNLFISATSTNTLPQELSHNNQNIEQEVEVGLIGFHIMQKTSDMGWVFSTFEQVDNVPNEGEKSKIPYTLYNPNCNGDYCQKNHAYVKSPYLWRETPPHAVTSVEVNGKKQIVEQIPGQIEREPIYANPQRANNIKRANEVWQNKLREINSVSVWQYYKLIGVQWVSYPGEPYNSEIEPFGFNPYNVAMEPYVEERNTVRQSCVSCHRLARFKNGDNADFSFLLFDKDVAPEATATETTK